MRFFFKTTAIKMPSAPTNMYFLCLTGLGMGRRRACFLCKRSMGMWSAEVNNRETIKEEALPALKIYLTTSTYLNGRQ